MAFTSTYPSPPRGHSRWREQVSAVAPALLTLALATTVTLLGWRGVDQAAQIYRVLEFRTHGLTLWDSGWYSGNLPLGYSVLFPAIGAILGVGVASVGAAVVATWAFDRVITAYFGSRPLGTWYFAISTLLPVTIGQWPFLTGEAFGLLALLALQRGKKPFAIALGLLAALCSPLAAAFLAMVCVAWAAHNSGRRYWLLATAAASLAIVGLIGIEFPGDGAFPFPWQGLVVTLLLCFTALTPLVRTTPAVRLGALIYAIASLFSFLVPNPLGGNAPRLAATIGIPLLACFLTAPGPATERLSFARIVSWATRGRVIDLSPRWRAAAVLLVVPFAVWQWAPSDTVVTSPSTHPELQQSYYQPLLTELAAVAPGPIRVEVPPTLEHWEATWLAPHVSLARGWERQLDVADNPIFYTTGALNATSYAQWLDSNGISWVALPSAPLDYAAQAEARLLESGAVKNLWPVWTTRDWTLWKVQGSPGLVSGPATVTELVPDHVIMNATAPGPLILRVHYTSFWKVTRGDACVGPAPDNWTQLNVISPGPLELSASMISPANAAVCPSR